VRPSERFSFIIFALYLPLEHSGVCVVYRLSSGSGGQIGFVTGSSHATAHSLH
jgi:hypothetical protein